MSLENATKLDWELHPENYATDDSGEFILMKDGTPRKRSGRAKGSKGSKTKKGGRRRITKTGRV